MDEEEQGYRQCREVWATGGQTAEGHRAGRDDGGLGGRQPSALRSQVAARQHKILHIFFISPQVIPLFVICVFTCIDHLHKLHLLSETKTLSYY